MQYYQILLPNAIILLDKPFNGVKDFTYQPQDLDSFYKEFCPRGVFIPDFLHGFTPLNTGNPFWDKIDYSEYCNLPEEVKEKCQIGDLTLNLDVYFKTGRVVWDEQNELQKYCTQQRNNILKNAWESIKGTPGEIILKNLEKRISDLEEKSGRYF